MGQDTRVAHCAFRRHAMGVMGSFKWKVKWGAKFKRAKMGRRKDAGDTFLLPLLLDPKIYFPNAF